jgi:SAM-dependent methyltransferase
MESDADLLRELIAGMRAAYARGENVMEHARRLAGSDDNSATAILVAYDLQAGSYVEQARENPEAGSAWCGQLAAILDPLVTRGTSLLEAGCGEATSLAGVLGRLHVRPEHALGFDISWSRCAAGNAWLREIGAEARLFVADLFEIPLADSSIDIVYTAHSVEPNGGRQKDALRELLRVARRAVVLVEPIYELAGDEARARMRHHGYVRNLREAAEAAGGRVVDYRLLPVSSNPLNPTGLILVEKPGEPGGHGPNAAPPQAAPPHAAPPVWRCPLTHSHLEDLGDVFAAAETGVAYPVLRAIPLLSVRHAVVASGLSGSVAE